MTEDEQIAAKVTCQILGHNWRFWRDSEYPQSPHEYLEERMCDRCGDIMTTVLRRRMGSSDIAYDD